MIERIPFTISDDGLDEIGGYVYLDDDLLVIDAKSAFLGIGKGDRQVVKVAPTALFDISLDRGIVRDKLRVAPKRLELLDAVPGDHAREVVLYIYRKHRPLLEDLVDEVQEWIIELEEDDD